MLESVIMMESAENDFSPMPSVLLLSGVSYKLLWDRSLVMTVFHRFHPRLSFPSLERLYMGEPILTSDFLAKSLT